MLCKQSNFRDLLGSRQVYILSETVHKQWEFRITYFRNHHTTGIAKTRAQVWMGAPFDVQAERSAGLPQRCQIRLH